MIEEQRFDGDLEHIHKSVEAPNMGQFMRDHCAELRFRKTGERRHREKNDGTEPAENGGRVQVKRLAKAHSALNAEALPQIAAKGKEFGCNRVRIAAAQTSYDKKSSRGAKTEEQNACEPNRDEPVHRREIDRNRRLGQRNQRGMVCGQLRSWIPGNG